MNEIRTPDPIKRVGHEATPDHAVPEMVKIEDDFASSAETSQARRAAVAAQRQERATKRRFGGLMTGLAMATAAIGGLIHHETRPASQPNKQPAPPQSVEAGSGFVNTGIGPDGKVQVFTERKDHPAGATIEGQVHPDGTVDAPHFVHRKDLTPAQQAELDGSTSAAAQDKSELTQ